MRHHGYQSYCDDEVLAASPWRLIEMLYGGALDSIAAARRHLRRKDILARTRAINKALRILTELSCSLNHEAGGDLSRRLAGIYSYVSRLLIEASTKQVEPPLAEAEALISTLAAAWKASTPPAPESESELAGELLLTDSQLIDTHGDAVHAAR
jgi:flagellar protein FliS